MSCDFRLDIDRRRIVWRDMGASDLSGVGIRQKSNWELRLMRGMNRGLRRLSRRCNVADRRRRGSAGYVCVSCGAVAVNASALSGVQEMQCLP